MINDKLVKRSLVAIVILAAGAGSLNAQDRDASLLTLDRIFNSREFLPDFFGPARWLSDGSGYTTLESSPDGLGREMVRYDPATGEREVIVPISYLTPTGESSPLSIADYSWSPDGTRLLIFTNTQRVWRRNTRGDYWLLELDPWKLHKLGGDMDPAHLMFAKFSPDGDRVAYVYKNDVYVEELSDGQITRLTEDGSETLINGTSDWVNEEEFDLRDGFRWSPDGERIAYWQFDIEGVSEFQLLNNTDSLYPKITSFPYPKAGEQNSGVRIGIVAAAGAETRWLEFEGDPRNHYIPRMEWAAGSDEVVVQRMNRLQNTNQVVLGDAETGDIRTVLTEADKAWVDVVDDLHWLDGGRYFTWISERDGWRHVYLVSRTGGEAKLITPGEFDVISVQRVDESGGWLYYIASPENPTQRFLYRMRLDGSGKPERLTPKDEGGTNRYQVAPDARWALHTRSSFGEPATVQLVSLPEHEGVRTLVDNAGLRAQVDSLARGPSDFFRVEISEGVALDGWQMKPPDFDPTNQYPVLFYVYGEPWGQTAADSWDGARYLWHLYLTQQGYVVMTVDNRGTPAPRGREWRKIIYRRIGVLAASDQARAVREITEWPYVDPGRIGIWGWSGGGSMTLNAMFRYPDLYHAGLAVAPVPDIRLYDTIYQERYMGLPHDNAWDYEQSSPITFASRLEGSLLLVHGTGDDNVHYQGTEELINVLIESNKQFTMMAYPNRSHGIFEGRGTTLHLFTLLTEFLKESLPPGPHTAEATSH